MINTSTRHIVLIDDDSDDFNVLCFILEDIKANVRISCVSETEGFIQKLRSDIPDLIFLDLAIPKKCGFECLQELQREPELRAIPVIVYTDSRNPQEIQKAYDLGASLYVQKPSSYSEFVQTMKRTLSLDLKIPQNVTAQTYFPGQVLSEML
jgi:CheY-like chemotaxis protein